MDKSLYAPRGTQRTARYPELSHEASAHLQNPVKPVKALAFKPFCVDKGTECHVTPASVAERMADYLFEKLECKDSARILEPHGGTGELVQALLKRNSDVKLDVIERHCDLVAHMQQRFSGCCINICQGDVFNVEFKHPYDGILANTPFRGVASHVKLIKNLLAPGGVAVILVPVTYDKIEHAVLEKLPVDTFSTCKVHTKIIRIQKRDYPPEG